MIHTGGDPDDIDVGNNNPSSTFSDITNEEQLSQPLYFLSVKDR
jgi:hypothetical protein